MYCPVIYGAPCKFFTNSVNLVILYTNYAFLQNPVLGIFSKSKSVQSSSTGGWSNENLKASTNTIWLKISNHPNGEASFNWLPGPSLNIGRRAHAAKLMTNPQNLEKYILVTGGVNEFNQPLDSVEILKINSDTWQIGK